MFPLFHYSVFFKLDLLIQRHLLLLDGRLHCLEICVTGLLREHALLLVV